MNQQASRAPWRSIGFWLVFVMMGLQAVYAARAFADPSAFANYRGTPLADGGDVSWVYIYATRTLFIALFLGVLLIRRDFGLLKWTALIGVVMPIGDAILAHQAGASSGIIGRHIVTLVYLIVTYLVLNAWTKRHSLQS